MSDAIVPIDSLTLTALVHRGTKWRRTFWEATCPELIIASAVAATPPRENYGVERRELFYRTYRGSRRFRFVSG